MYVNTKLLATSCISYTVGTVLNCIQSVTVVVLCFIQCRFLLRSYMHAS